MAVVDSLVGQFSSATEPSLTQLMVLTMRVIEAQAAKQGLAPQQVIDDLGDVLKKRLESP